MKDNSYKMSGLFLKINQLLWKKSYLQNLRSLFYFIDWLLLLFINKPQRTNREKKKILIIYNMALGDGIMFLGVSDYIRDIYSKEKFEITIACQTAFSGLYKNEYVFDRVLPLDFAGSIVNLRKRRNLYKQLRRNYYDIIIDPVGCDSCTTNIFATRASCGEVKIGVLDCTLPQIQCPKWMRNRIYKRIVTINKPNIHLIEYYAEFFRKLGAVNCVAKPANIQSVNLELKIPEKFFIVFPTASMAVKRWPLERFAELSKKIYEQTKMPLLVCGTNHDKVIVEEFLRLVPEIESINCIGQTNIIEFIELIGRASLVITNDTSAYHIAVAKQVNVALICGGYTFNRYANYDYKKLGYKNPILIYKVKPCFNCNNHCIYTNNEIFPCIDDITVEHAWNKIKQLISEEI